MTEWRARVCMHKKLKKISKKFGESMSFFIS
jgi:hypothetical protein